MNIAYSSISSAVVATNRHPFNLDDNATYCRWRDAKLERAPTRVSDIVVEVKNPKRLTASERNTILRYCDDYNMAIYTTPYAHDEDKTIPGLLAAQLGLTRLDHHLCVEEDGISAIQVSDSDKRHDYIPYTNKPINWHTDGYYNTDEHTIHAMLLHCVHAAAVGGENSVADHELAYIALREQNPDFIRALMQADVMTIPENVQEGKVIRPTQTGAVFTVRGNNPHLHMRYTARAHNIVWKSDDLVAQAHAALKHWLETDTSHVFSATLAPGQGLICNNVLHKRTSFQNGSSPEQQRLMYRARYYDRIREKDTPWKR